MRRGSGDKVVGDRIRQARKAAGLTQAQLAERVRVSEGIVQMWENARRTPSLPMVQAIALELMIDPAKLLNDEPPEGRYAAPVSDPKELTLLRQWRRLTPRAQDNLLELLGVTIEIAREVELQECTR